MTEGSHDIPVRRAHPWPVPALFLVDDFQLTDDEVDEVESADSHHQAAGLVAKLLG